MTQSQSNLVACGVQWLQEMMEVVAPVPAQPTLYFSENPKDTVGNKEENKENKENGESKGNKENTNPYVDLKIV